MSNLNINTKILGFFRLKRSFQPISLPINRGMVLRHLGITWQFPGTKSSFRVGVKIRGRADTDLRAEVVCWIRFSWRLKNGWGRSITLVLPDDLENMWVQHRLRLKQKGLWNKKSGTNSSFSVSLLLLLLGLFFLGGKVISKVNDFTTQNLANTAWAYAKFGTKVFRSSWLKYSHKWYRSLWGHGVVDLQTPRFFVVAKKKRSTFHESSTIGNQNTRAMLQLNPDLAWG